MCLRLREQEIRTLILHQPHLKEKSKFSLVVRRNFVPLPRDVKACDLRIQCHRNIASGILTGV